MWGDSHLRKPHVWLLEIQGIDTDPPDGKVNNRWMRLTTTLGLTFTDGYVLYNLRAPGVYGHYWYEFWDADLGRPLGEKSKLYEGRPGLYIREYTNGWAVYNHSGEAQVITLPAGGAVGNQRIKQYETCGAQPRRRHPSEHPAAAAGGHQWRRYCQHPRFDTGGARDLGRVI